MPYSHFTVPLGLCLSVILLSATKAHGQAVEIGSVKQQSISPVFIDADLGNRPPGDHSIAFSPTVLSDLKEFPCSFPAGLIVNSDLDTVMFKYNPNSYNLRRNDRRKLFALTVSFSKFGDAEVESFTSAQKDVLLFEGCRTKITDLGVSKMASTWDLIGLDVSYTRITDDALKSISSMHKLKLLCLSGTLFGEKSLEPLFQKTKQLKYLYLKDAARGHSAWSSVGELELEVLDASNTDFNDQSLLKLNASKMRQLYLHGTELSPSCLRSLATFKSLERISLSSRIFKPLEVKKFLPPTCNLILLDESAGVVDSLLALEREMNQLSK